ncbi:ABC transporter permease [Craurococcus roseus]
MMARRAAVLLPPWLWLLFLVAAPVAVLLAIALAAPGDGVPPVSPPFRWEGGRPVWQGGEALEVLREEGWHLAAFLRSFRTAILTALACLLLAYPMALGIARARPERRTLLLALVLLPFWTGFLPRVGAWIGLLRDGGWVNGVLMGLGLVESPVPLLYTDGALLLGMVHAYLPFAVLPLVAALTRLDPSLEEAAADLGASPAAAFRTVVLPLTLPGAAAGFLLVFIPAMGEVVIPELLGPPEARLVGRVLWEEFFRNRDWPLAAAVAVLLLLVLIPPIRLFQRLEAR